MSGDILTCLGHTDWHYFEPCYHISAPGSGNYSDGRNQNNLIIFLGAQGMGSKFCVRVRVHCFRDFSGIYYEVVILPWLFFHKHCLLSAPFPAQNVHVVVTV